MNGMTGDDVDRMDFDKLVGECDCCHYNPVALTTCTLAPLRPMPVDHVAVTVAVCEVCVSTFAAKTLRYDADAEITPARLIRSMAWMTNCILENIRGIER